MYVWLNNGTYGFLMGFGDEEEGKPSESSQKNKADRDDPPYFFLVRIY